MTLQTESGDFRGLSVISFESRRATQMLELIRRQGGDGFVAPSVKELPFEQHDEVYRWAERLFAGEFDLVVLMTGVGLRFLRDTLAERFPAEQFAEGLRKATIVARGPKPVAVLREMGIEPAVTVPEPNTWREVLAAIASRRERRITVQEYGRSNPELVDGLHALGASVTPIAIYRWALPDDVNPLREAARRIAERRCDIVLFTSQIQVGHLMQVAEELGLADAVRAALAEYCVIGSIGPVVQAGLLDYGLTPDITPEHPKMGLLVHAAAEGSAPAIRRKRGA